MARKRKHRVKTRRSGRFLGLYIFLTTILIVLTIGAGSIIFFKVSTIDVYLHESSGEVTPLGENSRCTQEDIVTATGIQAGDNLLLLNRSATAEKVLSGVPYVSSVSIEKKFPSTLNIVITESEALAAIETDGNTWWLVDARGKLLEQTQTKPDCTLIQGLTLVEPKEGTVINVPDGSKKDEKSQQMQKKSLIAVLPPLSDYNVIHDIRSMNLSSDSELTLDYQGRIKVKIALDADFDYQIKYFAKILSDYLPEHWLDTDTGTLDMTYDDGHPHLIKNP